MHRAAYELAVTRRNTPSRARVHRRGTTWNDIDQAIITDRQILVELVRPGVFTIQCPQTLDFHANAEETIDVFRAIGDISERPNSRLKLIDFGPIRELHPAASLVLVAEVDAWNQSTKRRLRAHPDRWDPDVRRLLIQMGFFELLRLQRPGEAETTRDDLTFIQFLSGEVVAGDKAVELRESIEGVMGKNVERQQLFHGISEALSNVKHHAYPDDARHSTRWWMSGSYDADGRVLTIMFYDRGVGIPATIPRGKMREEVRGILTKAGIAPNDDGHMIKAAMTLSRSATGDAHRGIGLSQMLDFAMRYEHSSLTIFSRRGKYMWARFGGMVSERVERISPALRGTLIEWNVTLM